MDPQLGPSRIAFPDPVGGWGIVIGGAVTLGIGLALCAMAATDTHSGGAVSDMFAGLCVLGAFVALGLGLLAVGIRSVVTKPVWHLCDHGMAVVTKSGAIRRMILWKTIPQLQIVQGMRGGKVVRYELTSKQPGLMLTVPSREVADRAYALWRADRQGPPR